MKLNLGAGSRKIEGFIGVDVSDEADVKVDLRFTPWLIEKESVDEILASHILEHFDKDDAIRFMKECHRILKPGGKLFVAVPDMDKFVEARLTGRWDDLIGNYAWRDLNNFLGGDEGEERPHWRHRYMYTFESLAFMLSTHCGFAVHGRKALPIDTQEYEKISLYVTAEKVRE